MSKYEFVFVDGERKPKMIFTPYVYAKINEYSTFFTIDDGKEIKVVTKEDIKNERSRKNRQVSSRVRNNMENTVS